MTLLADLFFRGGGIPRLQLGFDSPNKAAVLFGCLALVLAVAAFRARRRPAAVALGVASCLSWGGLSLTYSRGGLVAFSLGLMVVLGTFRRRLLKVLPLVLLFVGIVLAAVAFCSREKGLTLTNDASVGNRLEIWRTAPQMMADALTGWGIGNAGDAYMGWYQSLRSHERYRTLVSSHLTWLVELGLWGRIAYCAGWLLMLGLCFRRWRRGDNPLPLSVWLSFGIAAAFSSVAESPVLWLVPVVVAIPVVWGFVRNIRQRDNLTLIAGAAVFGVLLPLGMMWCGSSESAKKIDMVSLLDDVLLFGKGRPQTWIVKDLSVVGGAAYGRALRLYAQQATNVTCGIASELSDVPSDVRTLVLCGAAADVGVERLACFDKLKELRVLSPQSPETWLAATSAVPIRVFCGEFNPRCPSADHPRLCVVNGNGVFLTQWPKLALSREVSGGKTVREVPLNCEKENDR